MPSVHNLRVQRSNAHFHLLPLEPLLRKYYFSNTHPNRPHRPIYGQFLGPLVEVAYIAYARRSKRTKESYSLVFWLNCSLPQRLRFGVGQVF